MMLHEITRQAGRRKRRRRVGHGRSSGQGKTCGRGHKGSQARSGGGAHPLHEGGQMPIFRRLPKRGFSNARFRTEYEIVNLAALEERFDDGARVGPQELRRLRLVQGRRPRVKILGKGSLSKRLLVAAHGFSAQARAAIEQAGGSVTLLAGRGRGGRRPREAKGGVKRRRAGG